MLQREAMIISTSHSFRLGCLFTDPIIQIHLFIHLALYYEDDVTTVSEDGTVTPTSTKRSMNESNHSSFC